MKDTQARPMSGGFLRFSIVLLICFAICLHAGDGAAQIAAKNDEFNSPQHSGASSVEARYRSVINRLSAIESEILDLRNSRAQRDFDKVESALLKLQLKRKQLDELERQWRLLEGGIPALDVEPRLNFTGQAKRQMLVELEGTKEKVLRRKADLLKLSAGFGPGHPSIVAAHKELAELESVVVDQNAALEDLGVEAKSTVAQHKLKIALLRRVELKTRFGPGHPAVASIESEIKMLESESLAAHAYLAVSDAPSIELINANLELSEAGTKYGAGHPVCITLKKKIEVLEQLAKSESDSEAPANKEELAKRLATRIEALQDRILNYEEELDSVSDKVIELKTLEEKTQKLMKQRKELNAEMLRLSLEVQPKTEFEGQGRIRIKQQLLSGIDALEFLGRSDEAKQLREILSGLEMSGLEKLESR